MKKIPTFHENKIARLKDPEFALGYLNETLKDDDRRVFLIALRDVAEAYGGIGKISKLTKISREHLYRMLSTSGNPEFQTLQLLLESIGFRIAIEPKTKFKKAA